MDQTRAVAKLPYLDVEIAHRRAGDEVEQISIHLRASPSLTDFARYLESGPVLWPWLAFAPFVAWQQAVQSAFAPWLFGHRAFPAYSPERSSQHDDADDNVHPFPDRAERPE